VLRLFAADLPKGKSALTICLFQSFKERVPKPSWLDSVAVAGRCCLLCVLPLSIWECKGKQKFLFRKRKRKFFYFSRLRFSTSARLLLKRGAKVRRFFRLLQAGVHFLFGSVCRSGAGSKTKPLPAEFLTGQSFRLKLSLRPNPIALLAIGSAKVVEVFEIARNGKKTRYII
jgi:hypothetical protein